MFVEGVIRNELMKIIRGKVMGVTDRPTLIDTLIMCTMTGLAIITSGA